MTKREEFIKSHRIQLAQEYASNFKSQKKGLYPTELSLPIGLQFELTAKCNLLCKHCYNRSSSDRESPMALNDWANLVDDLISHGGIFQCIISGGEPLLMGHDMIDKIMKPLHNDGTGFILITNGYLVDQRWANELKNFNYYWVQVSIDHLLPEKHDEFRGKKGSWQKAVEAALQFSSVGLPLRIAHSLTPESLDYLPDFAEFAYQLGASSLICGEIMLSGRVNDNRDLLMSDEDYEKLYTMIANLQTEYQGKMAILASTPEQLEMRHRQKTLNTSMIIRPNGDVRLDCTMPFIIGNVLEKPFSEIWKEKGNTCWKNEKIDEYIKDLETNGYNVKHVNHVDTDILI